MKKINILLSALALCSVMLTGCNDEKALPPMTFPDGGSEDFIGIGTWNDPFKVWQVLSGTETPAEGYAWATGYIVGYINTFDGTYSKLREKSAVFGTAGAPNSNLLLADSPDEKDWEKCIPVQLAYGTSGRDLSLQNHPEYLGKQVTLRGITGSNYLGIYGLRSCDAYNWGDEGVYIAPPQLFVRTTELNDGDQCVMVAGGQYLAQPLSQTYTYGYLYVENVTAGTSVKSNLSNAFTFTKEGDYWVITDTYGRYVYMNASAQNFQVGYDKPTENYLWKVEFDENGTAVITNTGRGNWIQYSEQYSSYGCYPDSRGLLPALYLLQPQEEE